MPKLSLRLFGSPEIEMEGEPIKINRRKAIALLAYLAVSQQSHSRDALATMFWPEANQARARAALRSALWALNKTALADWLLVGAETVALRTATGTEDGSDGSTAALDVDVVRFRELLSAWQRHDQSPTGVCEACARRLAEAVALYENDFLAGFTLPDAPEFDEWHFFEANSLRENLGTALQALVAFHGSLGDGGNAIPYARRLVALDPLHEPAQRTLMALYAQAGQTSAALRQYRLCQELLQSELGLEPSPETEALYDRLRDTAGKVQAGETTPPEGGRAAPAGETQRRTLPHGRHNLPHRRHNLPPTPSPLIGRERELVALAAFLEDPATRLLTITGPGGIGKTRLALAAARDQLSQPIFPDGIYLVSLAPLSEPEAIFPAIAGAVGYAFQTDQRPPRRQIAGFLAQKSVLLLLDNFEHLLFEDRPDGAALVEELLQQAPHLKILATSREPLNLYGEQRYPLQGLQVPVSGTEDTGTDYPAAALFLQSVRRRQPGFEMAPAGGPFLAEICRLVEGMPLALELAASWIDSRSLRGIAADIRHNLDFLATNVRNIPARHRSMQAVFESSWQSLPASEQAVYARLSLFRGGFTQEAASAVAGASRTSLALFVAKSLLRFDPGQERYEQHELLRRYAAAKLGEAAEETRDRHAAYFSDFLHRREAELKGARRQQALAEIEADGENALAAWQRSVERSRLTGLEKALTAFALFYEGRARHEEGERICRLALDGLAPNLPDGGRDGLADVPGSPARLLAKLLVWHGRFHLHLQHYENARRILNRAHQVISKLDPQTPDIMAARAFLLLQLSDYAISNEFGGKAEAMIEESLALYRSLGDAWGTAVALEALGQQRSNLGLHEEAIRLQEESLAMRQRLQDGQETARAHSVLGLLLLHSGQIERSETHLRRSLAIYRTMENRAFLSSPLAVLGINRLFAGNFEESIASWEEAWAIHRELGLAGEPLSANVGMARARINLGRYDEARRQAQADLPAYRAVNHRWNTAFTLFNLGRIDLVEGRLEQARRRLWESVKIFQEMNSHRILPDALFSLALTFWALDDRQQTIENLIQGLQVAIAAQPLNPMRFELPAAALLLAGDGHVERAVEFYAAALQSPYIANSRWFEDIAGRRIREMAASLPPDVVAAAEQRGRDRDLLATAQALLAELTTPEPTSQT
jgi:predicted ATPase/DNA-binding SARP family transcriptional activator